ncbi:discoidin domain-containing protein [Deinococcus peraridilitoris]|uniref:F5/8 type C domain-containing protein n=1 Tax=Deinococcus peraridilitoris (strain DSM 19664 / LMG 22246 / CIP 109416 / KR-200) TaxID=937777 RepID=K9ZXY4_DEIPD|nr:discoidin domain-containing protein [Deinococcus peraridilitoris]AFZ66054.1 F5/8 type C domain-containing protein [Deinococcus peraridilitoris DSM 19664]
MTYKPLGVMLALAFLASCVTQAQGALIPCVSVTSSGLKREFPPTLAIDGKANTWFSANVAPQSLTCDLGSVQDVDSIDLVLYRGAERNTALKVDLAGSTSGPWVTVVSRRTVTPLRPARDKEGYQTLTWARQSARYIRVTGYGNSENSAVAINELRVYAPLNLIGTSLPDDATGTTTSPVSGEVVVQPSGDLLPPPDQVAYFVDCAGSDSLDGRDPTRAWRTLANVSTLSLNPGEGLYFKRGCSWDGQFAAKWNGTSTSNITIGAYGDTSLGMPKFRMTSGESTINVTGSYQQVRGLSVTVASSHVPPVPSDAVKCKTTPAGWRVGIRVAGSNNTIEGNYLTGLTVGIQTTDGEGKGRFNKILRNTLEKMSIASQNTPDNGDNDSGFFAILLNSDDNEVAWNTTSANFGCSEDYLIEGASIEIFRGSNNWIHHNKALNEATFSELGGSTDNRSDYNKYQYNLFVGADVGAELLVVRGAESGWGANFGTEFHNNTAYYVNVGIACFAGCDSTILSAHGNIIEGRSNPSKSEFYGQGADEGHNVIWRTGGGPSFNNGTTARASTTVLADPKFVGPLKASTTGDYRLQADSPALNRSILQYLTVTIAGVPYSVTVDLANFTLPSSNIDAGAFERQ